MERQISCIVILLLLFFAIYYYGYWVAISVASEKTSRVMEVLITSTKPQNIIVGQSLAMGLLGVMQLTLVILTGLVTNKIAYPEGGATVMGQTISFSSFSPFSILMLVVYFVLGYGLYAMMDAVAGASVSRSEDVNSALMPISLIAVISFYVSYMASVIPGGGRITAIASIVPFTAPFAMPGRMIAMEVPLWEIGLSLVLLIVTIVFFVKISVRFYSSAVLHYGKRLKLTELAKMSKNK
ncbi:MAG: hypothetical protein BGN88_14005 [Clostridiales bacterium 43-6]|nr:MAG: hypothetical protein BGN88_14005 [Clostridiales bacterium 43-6]